MSAIMPWYWQAEARELLRQCRDAVPTVVEHDQRFGRATDKIAVYDPNDERVARLRAILVHHCNPHLDQRDDAIAAGTRVSVEMAIDAVLPHPLIGGAGDPAYMAALPVIDLTFGRAAA